MIISSNNKSLLPSCNKYLGAEKKGVAINGNTSSIEPYSGNSSYLLRCSAWKRN